MKLIKLTAISAAVLASSAALAAEPVIVVDGNEAVVYEAEPVAVAYQAQPGYAYDADAGVVGNTLGGTKGFFKQVVNPASVSAEVGTLGYGANIGWSLNEKTELQAGWAGGDVADLFGGDFDANDVNYDVDSDFSNPYLGVQLRPTGNWFTMGAGIIVPDNDIDVTANAEGDTYRIGGQDYKTDEVLMMAYMNKEAYEKTVSTGLMTYYSRSRKSLWVKGETSGHYQHVQSLTIDCDLDTMLAKVIQTGVACHTGNKTCFFQPVLEKEIFEDVYAVIQDRKINPKEGSYTNYLFDKGVDKILKKVGEEATEIVIAAKNPNANEIKYEISDFLYHVMVLMVEKGVTWAEITEELAKR